MRIIPSPRLYLGTMTFGWSGQTSSIVDEAVALEMVQKFCTHEQQAHQAKEAASPPLFHIDTARIYSGGKTEPILGTILPQLPHDVQSSIRVGTKAHPSQEMGLSAKGIQLQYQSSITAMNMKPSTAASNPSIGEYYLHQPDTENTLLESLQTVHEMITTNQISSFGMSNYNVDEMKRTFDLCDEHGLTHPTVYQGLYNPLNRLVEKKKNDDGNSLLELLKENGCSFVAYNPLAAGLLTGKHKNDEVKEGRFKNNPNYLPRFYTDTNFEALELIQRALKSQAEKTQKKELTLIEATFAWLLRYSALTEKDGVLLGASSIQQLEQNLDACRKATEVGDDDGDEQYLSDEVLEAFDQAWKITEKEAFPYWRSYSSDMPGRESLDQGASYSAAKTKA